ncbi:hypothetical protein [Azospirillum sp. TSH100]|uniref:hypothetical protein n=1 Tax=Azospirillum sp. TSH100 TaxID=652764 RepID=UPI003526FEC9
MIVAAFAALLAMLAVGSAVSRAAAEPLLSAPEAAAPTPSPTPAKPQTDAFDCWLLDPDRLEQASGRGLCGDAFARAPETAALPEAPPPPSVTPARKPKPSERRARGAGRNVSSSETHAMASSPARVSPRSSRRDDGDFFTNFQRDFRSLTNLLSGGGPSPRRGDGGVASDMSHDR